MGGPGRLEVWLANLRELAPAILEIEAETPRLPGASRAETESDVAPSAAARDKQVAHIALRIVLERFCGSQIRQAAFSTTLAGKPYLPSVPQFSLSHSSGFGLIAVATAGRIGVDIEGPRRIGIPADRLAMIVKAAALLAPRGGPQLPGTAAALQAWVRLEALAKADGRGIGRLLTDLGILGRRTRDIAQAVARLDQLWTGFEIQDLVLDNGLVASLATEGPSYPQVVVQTLPTTKAHLAALPNRP